MKKLVLVILTVFLFFSDTKSQLQMNDQGEIGIGEFWGGEPRRLFDINGYSYFSCIPANSGFYFESYYSAPMILPQWNHSMYLGRYDRELWRIYTEYIRVKGVYLSSDKKIKENVKPLKGSLKRLKLTEGVEFDYKVSFYSDTLDPNRELLLSKRKGNIGFIAQDIQKIYPKLVEYNEESDLLEVNYIGIIPELVEAIKEQQQQIEILEDEIKKLKNKNKSGSTTETNKELEINENNSTFLYQNSPNPFTNITQIGYYLSLSENVKNAIIYIYDMNGTQLKKYDLHQKGNGRIIINGSELKAGMYMYSLISDKKLIDT